MQFIYALLLSLMAGLATIIGGLIIFFRFKEENVNKFIVGALSFSLAPEDKLNKAAAPSPINRAKASAITVKG